MINIQLTELDLSLEVAELGEQEIVLDDHSSIGLQGPLNFDLDPMPIMFGYLDLDLLGFPYHGLSAYQLAVQEGFIGSLQEWLASLKGEDGELGQAGRDGVAAAIAAAQNAAVSANAAAGFRTEAYTYSGVAGVHAQSAAEMYTLAVAARDETGQIATAMTLIRQESEAMIIGTREIATATIQERVRAETARSEAELSRTRAALSETSADASRASASDSATMAVEARNQAGDRATAAVLASSEANTYADDARVEADASRTSQLIASAARDEAQLAALAVAIDVTTVTAAVTAAGSSATAANTSRIAAETAAGQALVSETASAASSTSALGYRNAAQTYSETSVAARDSAGIYAGAALTYRNEAFTYANTAGAVYLAVANRVDVVEAAIGPSGANITDTRTVAINARDQLAEARLRLVVAASGGNPAIFEMFSATGATSFIRLLASQIFFGANTFFDDASDTFQTLTGDGGRMVWGGPFGIDSEMLIWFGSASEPLSNMGRGNAYVYFARNAPRVGGLDFPTGGGGGFVATISSGGAAYGDSAPGGGVASTSTLTVTAPAGSTVRWVRTDDVPGSNVVAFPTGLDVYFTGTVPPGGLMRGIFQGIVTGPSGQTQIVIADAYLSDPT